MEVNLSYLAEHLADRAITSLKLASLCFRQITVDADKGDVVAAQDVQPVLHQPGFKQAIIDNHGEAFIGHGRH
jgi:hypothetical protein